MRTASVVATLKEESLWGATLLSAICAGTPVVASDIAANREVAATGEAGVKFVSRRASPFAIAEAIRQLAGVGSRPHPELVPTWEDTTERVMSVYREILSRERPVPDLDHRFDDSLVREAPLSLKVA